MIENKKKISIKKIKIKFNKKKSNKIKQLGTRPKIKSNQKQSM